MGNSPSQPRKAKSTPKGQSPSSSSNSSQSSLSSSSSSSSSSPSRAATPPQQLLKPEDSKPPVPEFQKYDISVEYRCPSEIFVQKNGTDKGIPIIFHKFNSAKEAVETDLEGPEWRHTVVAFLGQMDAGKTTCSNHIFETNFQTGIGPTTVGMGITKFKRWLVMDCVGSDAAINRKKDQPIPFSSRTSHDELTRRTAVQVADWIFVLIPRHDYPAQQYLKYLEQMAQETTQKKEIVVIHNMKDITTVAEGLRQFQTIQDREEGAFVSDIVHLATTEPRKSCDVLRWDTTQTRHVFLINNNCPEGASYNQFVFAMIRNWLHFSKGNFSPQYNIMKKLVDSMANNIRDLFVLSETPIVNLEYQNNTAYLKAVVQKYGQILDEFVNSNRKIDQTNWKYWTSRNQTNFENSNHMIEVSSNSTSTHMKRQIYSTDEFMKIAWRAPKEAVLVRKFDLQKGTQYVGLEGEITCPLPIHQCAQSDMKFGRFSDFVEVFAHFDVTKESLDKAAHDGTHWILELKRAPDLRRDARKGEQTSVEDRCSQSLQRWRVNLGMTLFEAIQNKEDEERIKEKNARLDSNSYSSDFEDRMCSFGSNCNDAEEQVSSAAVSKRSIVNETKTVETIK